jgi:hypothetical protein
MGIDSRRAQIAEAIMRNCKIPPRVTAKPPVAPVAPEAFQKILAAAQAKRTFRYVSKIKWPHGDGEFWMGEEEK